MHNNDDDDGDDNRNRSETKRGTGTTIYEYKSNVFIVFFFPAHSWQKK